MTGDLDHREAVTSRRPPRPALLRKARLS
jgi:hypothetical protein